MSDFSKIKRKIEKRKKKKEVKIIGR